MQSNPYNVKKIIIIIMVSLALIAFWGCDSENKNARIEVWLTDAPGDFQQVNIDIQHVEIHAGDGDQGNGWRSLQVNKGVYDLLELTNGLDTLLGTLEVPAGKISQIRLKLGPNNSIKVNDEIFSLSTPSAQQSGLKLQVHETLTEGITYKILLDFDVARSILQTGNGQYVLKPVIRSVAAAQDGAIGGRVDPKESTPAVYAVSGADTVTTAFTDSTGAFLLRGLPSGSYQVVFSPQTGYQVTVKEAVSVTTGKVTDIGTVTIQEN